MEQLAQTWADGDAEQREQAYTQLETSVRGCSTTAAGGAEREQTVALAAACVQPLIGSVLCASVEKTEVEEWMRASLLLAELVTLAPITCGRKLYPNGEGVPGFFSMFSATDNVFVRMIDKDPSDWGEQDAAIVACAMASWCPQCTVGGTAILAGAGGDACPWQTEQEFMNNYLRLAFVGNNPQPSNRFVPLALLILDRVLRKSDAYPVTLIAGAWHALCWMPMLCSGMVEPNGIGKALFQAGFLDEMMKVFKAFSLGDRISRSQVLPTATLCAMKDTVQTAQLAGCDVVQPLLDAGALDVIFSCLTAYQVVGPAGTSVCAIQWGVLFLLESLISCQAVVERLRSGGKDTFRFLLDNPLVFFESFGMETRLSATRIAVQIWGRAEADAFQFKQKDIDAIVRVALEESRGFGFEPVAYGPLILNLCVVSSPRFPLIYTDPVKRSICNIQCASHRGHQFLVRLTQRFMLPASVVHCSRTPISYCYYQLMDGIHC